MVIGILVMDKFKCLKDSDWELLLNNQLNESDKQVCLEHIQSCEICKDMQEGLLLLHKNQLQESLARIDKAIQKRIQPERAKIRPLWVYSAAAVLLASISGLLFLLQPKQELAKLEKQNSVIENTPFEKPQSDAEITKNKVEASSASKSSKQVPKQLIVPEVYSETHSQKDNNTASLEELPPSPAPMVESINKESLAIETDAASDSGSPENLEPASVVETKKVNQKLKEGLVAVPSSKGKILPAASNAIQNNAVNLSANDFSSNKIEVIDSSMLRLHLLKEQKEFSTCRNLADSLLSLPGYTYQANRIALVKGLCYLEEDNKAAASKWLKTFKWEKGKSATEYKLLREAIRKKP